MKKLVLASLVASATLFAGNNAGFEITYNKTKVTKSHSVNGSVVADANDDLGWGNKDSHINAKIWTWLNEDNRISLGYEGLTFDATKKLTNNLGATGVPTRLDLDWFNIGWANKLASTESFSLLGGIDLNLVHAQETIGAISKGKLLALPTVAFEALYDFNGFGIDTKIAGMTYGSKGNFYEGRAGLFFDAPFVDTATLRAGYQVKKINDMDYKGIDGDYQFAGWYVGLGATFGGAKVATPITPKLVKLDGDNDGVINSKDLCPNTPAGLGVDANGCELDSDNDGVVNSKDLCPNTVKGASTNANGCELDSDNDGVVNSNDNCPNTLKGASVNAKGCATDVTLNIIFPYNSSKVSSKYLTQLKTISKKAVASNTSLVVEGHTDSIGSARYNKSLSLKRAVAVSKILVQNGVKASKISAIGLGEAKPVASNVLKSGRAQNRRIVIKFLK